MLLHVVFTTSKESNPLKFWNENNKIQRGKWDKISDICIFYPSSVPV